MHAVMVRARATKFSRALARAICIFYIIFCQLMLCVANDGFLFFDTPKKASPAGAGRATGCCAVPFAPDQHPLLPLHPRTLLMLHSAV